MNNSDLPVMPFTHKPEYQYQESGLTKREHFASIAPEMPSWFGSSFKVIDSDFPAIDHSDEQIRLSNEYNSDNYGLSEQDFETGSRVSGEIRKHLIDLDNEHIKKSFFAWRTFYADELLKELLNE